MEISDGRDMFADFRSWLDRFETGAKLRVGRVDGVLFLITETPEHGQVYYFGGENRKLECGCIPGKWRATACTLWHGPEESRNKATAGKT